MTRSDQTRSAVVFRALGSLALLAGAFSWGTLSAAERDYRVTDPQLDLVLVDSSPNESFLSMRADSFGRLFVGAREAIFVYEPDARGGLQPRRQVFRFPPDSWVYDIEIRGEDLYAMTNRALYLLPGAVTRRQGVKARRLVWGHPDYHPHQCFHGLAWGPDGDLYLSLGDMLVFYGDFRRPDHWGHWTFFCQPEGTRVPYTGVGGVLRCRPDGSRLQVVARGTRNSCGLVFDRRWNLFTHDNDHEGLPLDFVPGRLLHVTPGADFGWPRGWMPSKTPDRADLLETMVQDMGRGVPVGQSYYDEPYLPGKYRHNLLLARWGRRALTRYTLTPHGATFRATEHVLLEGFDQARPVGVTVGRGGRIFVTLAYMAHNDGSPVYRSDLVMIRRRGEPSTSAWRGYEAVKASEATLWRELECGASWRSRRAFVELLRRGGKTLGRAAARLGRADPPSPVFPHLVWLAAVAAREGFADRQPVIDQLAKLATDRRGDVREVVSRALVECFANETRLLGLWTKMLEDPDPRLRHAGVLAQRAVAAPDLARVVNGPARSRDTYLRQSSVQLLAARASLGQLEGWCRDSDARIRLAGVLAVGTRLTIPPAVGPLKKGLPLQGWPDKKVYRVTYVGETIDIRTLGPVGVFSTADHWAAGKHAPQQESLFGFLMARLEDPAEPVRLQAAHFLSLLRDARSDPVIERVRIRSQRERLTRSPIRGVGELWVCGPFSDRDRGFRQVHVPETAAVNLVARYRDGERMLKWERLRSRRMFDFHRKFGNTDGSSCYAYLRLISPRKQQVLLTPGSDDGLKVWVNGRLVHAKDVVRGGLPLQDVVFAELQPGSNEVLFRVRNVAGEHNLYLHYRSLEGSVQVTLPEQLDASGLAKRLQAAAADGQAKIGPGFLDVDWVRGVKQGNVARGRRLFSMDGIGCAKCHAAAGLAAVPGAPSLVGSGRRFTVPYLVESILLPDRKISPVFRSTVIATSDGKVHTGLVLGETGTIVTLLTREAKRIEIKKGEIEDRKRQNVSAMPAGLVKTPQELKDLLAFLLAR